MYDAPENARQVNKHYAAFFLPFWWEHILLRGILDHAEHQKIIDKLGALTALPPVQTPAPLPPPAALPPPLRRGKFFQSVAKAVSLTLWDG